MRTLVRSVALLLTAAVCACSSDGKQGPTGNTPDDTETIEILSYWVGPGEAEALQALLDLNRETYPQERIYNGGIVTGTQERVTVDARFAADDPPDLFQYNAFALKDFIAANPGKVAPIDELIAENGLRDVIVPEILDNVTVDGHVYAMPVNAHRENSLFYNTQIFLDNGLEPPTTQAEFLAVCAKLKKKGIPAVAVSTSQGWIVTRLFNELALGSMGGQAYADYFSGAKPLDEAAMGTAIDLLDEVLTHYINPDANDDGFGWDSAAKEVFDGKAAMFLHGDWAKAYFVQLGWAPDVDFGVVASPGATDVFLYGVDSFGLPVGAKDPDGAQDFLRTIASTQGQVAFNAIKGSSPMRLDVPLTKFDPMAREVIASFKSAKLRLPVRAKDVWDNAMGAFAQSHDKAALIQVFKDNPPTE
ncbi:MAG: ABC transporter substrate-binding protein [Polyangiaceae bacterium]